jgi:hypothetical protein
MTQSPEYPDLPWMPPKSWTDANRTSVQLIVIHTTEGSRNEQSAEDGAAYDQRRTDGTSTHYFHDMNSTVQCVRTTDQAHAARAQGNRRGIQHELCGRAAQPWGTAEALGTLRQAARQCARDVKRWGIPVRHLTVAQVAAGEKGFCGHVDITYAFPQDNGTHTDPGPNFPWSQFLDLVRAEMEEIDMALTADDIRKAAALGFYDAIAQAAAPAAGDPGKVGRQIRTNLQTVVVEPVRAAIGAGTVSVVSAVAAADADDGVDIDALAAALTEKLPGVQAQALLDALAARLSSPR